MPTIRTQFSKRLGAYQDVCLDPDNPYGGEPLMQTLSVKVADIRQVTPVIRQFTFVPTAGGLPGFSAGSHVVVEVPLSDRKHQHPPRRG